ncbi:MAG: AmpG family muropeptide MFS transporter, partial [Alphaproteobacteria bacterium]|nr:AmpG family muropeptide MFS transporter [Alphaproteobacteria bacterium]
MDTLILFAVIAAVVALAFFVPSFAPYRRKMPFVAFLLGISSGFPLTLLLATMTFWLSKVGIDKTTIGFAIGLTTPYTLKFLWAPLVDKLRL